MNQSRPAIELVRAVLGDTCRDDAEALFWLEKSLAQEIEPFHFFSVTLGLSDNLVYQRAAEWAGLAFSDVLPRDLPLMAPVTRPEALAEVKSVRAELYGRDVLFTACGLTDILRIDVQARDNPDLRHKICVVPPRALRAGLTDRSAALLTDEARTRLSRRWPFASAHLDLSLAKRIVFVVTMLMLLALSVATPFFLQPVLVPLMGLLLLGPAILRLVAGLRAWFSGDLLPPPSIPDEDLPVYTVLLPMRDEANMVRQLADALQRLDYPAEKLDIKFVVEAKSVSTLHAAAAELGDPRFELVIVPDSRPHTKPKALNYALPLARGEFVVIFDAEDIPDPDQLRWAVGLFRDQPELDCVQAELVIDNAGDNWLTALFAGEYAGLFGLILPALGDWDMPLPLGGTSNHFRLQSLREAGGWDAFNVTEDADLGVRLKRLRYRSGTFSAQTREEAPVSLSAFLNQRTRWSKGWMQTFLAHNSRPFQLFRDLGWRNFLIFETFVGGLVASALLHLVFLAALALRYAIGLPTGLWPSDLWSGLSLLILAGGYSAAFAVSILGLMRLRRPHLLAFQPLLPVYWMLTSIAAFRALYELLTRPHFWSKTPHGLSFGGRSRRKGPKL
ncbi:MAG: glycosyltransferase [Hyphomicrobiaceae bacterium]|nr:glycosyltransferase [Hyphomicrobiaceae bacterium]